MKKIVILGRGTAGSQAIIHFQTWLKGYEIEWRYDPSIPVQAVGEGSQLGLPRNLYKNMGFTHSDLPKIYGTFKLGILKKNWGIAGKEFFHHFPEDTVAYHFNAVALQNYIFDYVKDKVSIVESHCNPEEIDADYIIDCSGKPKDYSDFNSAESIPVNSVHVTQCFWDYPKFQYTLAIARPYGWVFGIPLTNRCSIGYMYNKDINTLEEVKEDVKEIFKEYDLTPSDTTNSFSFNNYYRKKNFSNRIAHNGNASFFLEPLEATSITMMETINRKAFDFILQQKSLDQINEEYLDYVNQIQTMISLHYFSGSVFKTKFWDMAKEKATIRIEKALKEEPILRNLINAAYDSKTLLECRRYFGLWEFGTWSTESYKENLDGLGLYSLV